MITTIVRIVQNKITKDNVDCPYCYDNVSDLKEHLGWCEYYQGSPLLFKLGLMEVEE